MKLSSSTYNYTIGVLFLILLSSHEIIIHARNIERHAEFMTSTRNQNNIVQNNKYMRKILNDISSKTENEFVDDNMYFIEEAEKVVMNSYSPTTTSTSSSFITPLHKDANDILQLHETLKNSFTFMNSPMLNELEELTPVSPSFLEMPTENFRSSSSTL